MLTIHLINENGSVEERRVYAATVFHDTDAGHIRPSVSIDHTGKPHRPKTSHEQAAEKYHEDFFRFFDEMEQAMGEAVNG